MARYNVRIVVGAIDGGTQVRVLRASNKDEVIEQLADYIYGSVGDSVEVVKN